MTKSKISILNALSSLLQMIVTSVLGLVLGRSILTHFGSDYNGVNSTVTQIVSTLMIFEGGFTLASNVALFEPFSKKDYDRINGILSATKRRFLIIGLWVGAVGAGLSAIYPFAVSSAMPKWMIGALMLTVVFPTFVNLAFNMKFRVLILAAQKEYIISVFTTITYIIGNVLAIVLIQCGASLLVARLVIMFSMLAGYVMIAGYCTRAFSFVSFKAPPMFNEIKGTKSVVALKVMSVFYTSAPIILISMIPGEGVLLASVYAVYKSIVYTVKNALVALCNAPRLSFGALFAEGDFHSAKRYFDKYEMVTCIFISVFLGVTCFLLLPFIELYTQGVTDINYRNIPIAIMLLLTSFIEICHIPSGQIIQMKGDFAESKRMQKVACVIGRIFLGVEGVIFSVLLAAIVLAIMEISYVAKNIFHRNVFDLIKNFLPCAFVLLVAAFLGMGDWIKIENYIEFILAGFASVLVFGIVTFLLYFLVKKDQLLELVAFAKRTFLKKK